MVGSGLSFFLGACVLLPRGSIAATLTTEGVVRREVKVGSQGELSRQTPKEDVQIDASEYSTFKAIYTPEYMEKLASDPVELAKLATQWCNTSYAYGVTDGRTASQIASPCGATSQHEIMISPSMCIQAAQEAGASTDHNNWMTPVGQVGRAEFRVPKGCFKAACVQDATKVCFFYNAMEPPDGSGHFTPDPPSGDYVGRQTAEAPIAYAGLTGTPVCHMPRWEFWDAGTDACPAGGYALVDDDASCRLSTNCGIAALGYDERVGIHNASKHLDYVRGCFKDAATKDASGQVFYNGPSAMGEPHAHARGIQICNASNDFVAKAA